jgi:hypothetical protein
MHDALIFSDPRWTTLMVVIFGILAKLFFEWYRTRPCRPIVVRYHPPKKISLLKAGIIWDGFIGTEEITATLLELATKGHIALGTHHGKHCLQITSKTSGIDPFQRKVLKELFGSNTVFSPTADNPLDPGWLASLSRDLSAWAKRRGYMDDNPFEGGGAYMGWMLALSWIFGSIAIASVTYFFDPHAPASTFEIAVTSGISAMAYAVLVFSAYVLLLSPTQKWWWWIELLALYAILIWIGLDPLHISPWLILSSIPIGLGATIYYWRRFRKNKTGNTLKAHLRGLKAFMERVDAQRIAYELERDPLYLEKLLPYAMLFRINDHWLDYYQYDPIGLSRLSELLESFPQWIQNERRDFWKLDPVQ